MLTNILIAVVVLVLFLAAFMLFRTLTFARSLPEVEPAPEIEIDAEAVAARLAGAIRCQTITVTEDKPENYKPFDELHDFLRQAYPHVHASLERQIIGKYALLYTWKGTDPQQAPLVLMAHQDVVPIDPATLAEWEHPPFEGAVADGYVWGRGALDCKHQLICELETVERLLAQGHQPARTIYLAFGADEEIGGFSAKEIANWFAAQDIHPYMVLDEGMAVVEQVLPGIDAPIGLVGLAEKGFMTLELSVDGASGHSSTPPRETAIGILSKALAFLEAMPFPAHMHAVNLLFKGVGSILPFKLQFAFANMWLMGGTVRKQLEKAPMTNAMIRTTTAPTIFNAGVRENVLPSRATARVNFRLLPGDTIASACERVRKTIDDERVKFEPLQNFISEPSTYSRTDSEAYEKLSLAVRQVFGGIPVAPMLVLGGTDARSYHPICDSTYRFCPMLVSNDDLKRVHNLNERISLDNLVNMVRFYDLLIKNI